MIGKFVGLAVIVAVGFYLSIRGNPSYWQIIGLLLMMVPVGGGVFLTVTDNAAKKES